MLFSPTKMENVSARGVLLKKQRWRCYSSPREAKDFFRKLTLNTLTTGFLLVLPKFHSFDGRISPEETLVKRRMHKSEHLKGNLIILINLLSIQNILLSAVPVSPFNHPKHGKKASPIRLQIKFGFWACWKLRTWIVCPHISFQNQTWSLFSEYNQLIGRV